MIDRNRRDMYRNKNIETYAMAWYQSNALLESGPPAWTLA